jgi:hypothetical protein
MKNNQKNLSVLANRFKVEELKQRIEFDIAMEQLDTAGEWKDGKASVGVSVDAKGVPKAEIKWTW